MSITRMINNIANLIRNDRLEMWFGAKKELNNEIIRDKISLLGFVKESLCSVELNKDGRKHIDGLIKKLKEEIR